MDTLLTQVSINPLVMISGMMLLGFIASKIARALHLPSILGYLLIGFTLNSLFNIFPANVINDQLNMFSSSALLLIAFLIGEKLNLKSMAGLGRTILITTALEAIVTFLSVTIGFILILTGISNFYPDFFTFEPGFIIVIATIFGAISISTSPVTISAIIRECQATGKFSQFLLSVITIDNAISIFLFSLIYQLGGDYLSGGNALTLSGILLYPLFKVVAALLLGACIGFTMDMVIHRLKDKYEILTFVFVTLLLCSGLALQFGLSPLLVGISAGFVLVNRGQHQADIFQIFYDLEPPLIALFFITCGMSLSLNSGMFAGMLFGILLVFLRVLGKLNGSTLGADMAKAPNHIKQYLGITLIPQATTAIGMVFIIQNNSVFSGDALFITSTCLSAIVINEFLGPILTRFGIQQAQQEELALELIPVDTEIEQAEDDVPATPEEVMENIQDLETIQIVENLTYDELPATESGNPEDFVQNEHIINVPTDAQWNQEQASDDTQYYEPVQTESLYQETVLSDDPNTNVSTEAPWNGEEVVDNNQYYQAVQTEGALTDDQYAYYDPNQIATSTEENQPQSADEQLPYAESDQNQMMESYPGEPELKAE